MISQRKTKANEKNIKNYSLAVTKKKAKCIKQKAKKHEKISNKI